VQQHPALIDKSVAAGWKRRDRSDGAESEIPPRMQIQILNELPDSVNRGMDLDLNIDRLVPDASSLPHRG
jgi:hypothetical protein